MMEIICAVNNFKMTRYLACVFIAVTTLILITFSSAQHYPECNEYCTQFSRFYRDRDTAQKACIAGCAWAQRNKNKISSEEIVHSDGQQISMKDVFHCKRCNIRCRSLLNTRNVRKCLTEHCKQYC
jgi:hypothetical protein